MTKEQAKQVHKEIVKVADGLGLKAGVKITIQEAAKKATDAVLSQELEASFHATHVHDLIFDIIDTNNDGHISMKEFGDCFYILLPDLTEAEVVHSFNTIDANKNGEISREELKAAAHDFLHEAEETELSTVFCGKLLD